MPEEEPKPEDTTKLEGTETTEINERTRESEIQANVELWRDLGIEVDESDVRAKIEELPEVEGFNWYFYMPKGIKTSEIWTILKEEYNAVELYKVSTVDIDATTLPRSNDQDSYAIACRYSRDSDPDTYVRV